MIFTIFSTDSGESLQTIASRVFEGEDSLSSCLGSLHDSHLLCITEREKQLHSHLQTWMANTVQDLQK